MTAMSLMRGCCKRKGAVSIKLRLTHLFNETFEWLQTEVPPIEFKDAKAISPATAPLRLQHPRIKDIAVMIDTHRRDVVTSTEMVKTQVIAYLTEDSLYLQRFPGQIEKMNIPKSEPGKSYRLDQVAYKNLERSFNWIFYPSLLLFIFVAFASSMAVAAVAYAVALSVIGTSWPLQVTFGQQIRLAIHAQSAGCLLYSLDAVLPVAIPRLFLISIAMTCVSIWRAVGASKYSVVNSNLP
jgi:hypothetical protein